MPFVIDIDPVDFDLFGIPVRWYGIIVGGAALVAVWLARTEARRRGVDPELVAEAAVWVAGAALVGGRVSFVVQRELDAWIQHPIYVLLVWQGGLSFSGGLLAGLAALLVFARRRGIDLLVALDITAPAAAAGQAIGHVGCLVGGDSYGIPTDLPWAVVYRDPAAMAPQGIPLHPTQAYEAILLGLLFVGLWRGRERLGGLGAGMVAGMYLLLLSLIRFGLFFLRDEPPLVFGLKTAQLLGLGIAALAIVLLVVARRSPAPTHRVLTEVLPADKAHEVRRLQLEGPTVGMVAWRPPASGAWPPRRTGLRSLGSPARPLTRLQRGAQAEDRLSDVDVHGPGG